MIKQQTTLVLGAGASLAYGYPLGRELRTLILSIESGATREGHAARTAVNSYMTNPKGLVQFLQAFRHSQMESIDSFLARRTEFSDIGKLCIAAVLLSVESDDNLFGEVPVDHWYRYLWQQVAADSWEELSFDNLSVVTFNYDCSLERFLHVAIQHAYGKTAEEATKKLKTLEIVHVYGSLGASLPDDPKFLAYAGGVGNSRIRAAANMISVVPEGRNDNPHVMRAQSMLANTDAIAFLGFGFDAANLDRLNTQVSCGPTRLSPTGTLIRKIVATSIGMTAAEIQKASRRMGKQGHTVSTDAFMDKNCIGLLRESLILG